MPTRTGIRDAAQNYPAALSAALIKWTCSGNPRAFAAPPRLSGAPPDFASRCHAVLGALGTQADELAAALDAAEVVVEDMRTACART